MTQIASTQQKFALIDQFRALGHELSSYGAKASSGDYRMEYLTPHWNILYQSSTDTFECHELPPYLDRGNQGKTTLKTMQELSDFFHTKKKEYDKRMKSRPSSNNEI